MTPARSETLHDLVTFVVRVWLTGLLAAVSVPLALVAGGADLLAGHRRADGHLRRVLEANAALQHALDARRATA